jgi:hypothetical protein
LEGKEMEKRKQMTYPNIKKAGLKTKEIAEILGYKNANSFRNSTKYRTIMEFTDYILGLRT